MYRRVIFLDIDGVLNNEAFARSRSLEKGSRRSDSIDPMAVTTLRCVIEETGAVIVISSAWRHGDDWQDVILDVFARAGWDDPPIIDRTPSLLGCRGEEIDTWLMEHSTESYLIIDDDSDMLEEQIPFFIRCDPRRGLTEDDATLIKAIWPD